MVGGTEVGVRFGVGDGAGSRSGFGAGRTWDSGAGPSPMRLFARSPLEPCCWSTAESSTKSPTASPSVSAAWDETACPRPGAAPPKFLETECSVRAASGAGFSLGAQ